MIAASESYVPAGTPWLAVRDGGDGRIGDLFAFLVPAALFVNIRVGGDIYLSEIVLLAGLPFLIDAARRRGVSRIPHRALMLGALWLSGLVCTDIYRESSFHDYSRGWANVAVFLVDLCGVALLVDETWRRVTLFASGLVVAEMLGYLLNPSPFAAAEPWKFGYGSAVTLGVVVVVSRPRIYRSPTLAVGILLALGVVNLKMGFRSLAGVCFMTALLVWLASRSAQLVRFDRRALRTATVVGVSVLTGLAVVSAYGYVASRGLLGNQAQQKYEKQQGDLGVVVGGRPQFIPSLMAVGDSPILGHGSWAKGPKYVAALQNELAKEGYPESANAFPSELIPSHSYLLGAWVDAGTLGALFWFWVLGLGASIVPRLHRLTDGRIVLTAFLGLSFLWAVAFSPLGAQARVTAAFSLVVLLMARTAAKRPEEELPGHAIGLPS